MNKRKEKKNKKKQKFILILLIVMTSHRKIIRQNSKLDHAINFILLDQNTTNRIELKKTVKIGVVIVIR